MGVLVILCYIYLNRKKDSELFPNEIFNSNKDTLNSIPHSVVLVFDGSTDIIIAEEDEKFYKEIIDLAYSKGKIT